MIHFINEKLSLLIQFIQFVLALEEDEGVLLGAAVVALVQLLLLREGDHGRVVELAVAQHVVVLVDQRFRYVILELMRLELGLLGVGARYLLSLVGLVDLLDALETDLSEPTDLRVAGLLGPRDGFFLLRSSALLFLFLVGLHPVLVGLDVLEQVILLLLR